MNKGFDLSANSLKTLAVCMMFIDHLVWWQLPLASSAAQIIHSCCRIVAPIMCYFVAEGYFHSKNLKKYLFRLFLLAAVSHFPYVCYFNYPYWDATSVAWGLALGLLSLIVFDNKKIPLFLRIVIVILCCRLAVDANWSYTSVLWILWFGISKNRHKVVQILGFILIGYIFYAFPMCLEKGWIYAYQFAIVLAIPFLLTYKGRRGERSFLGKRGFYIFYPAHFILLYILRYIV